MNPKFSNIQIQLKVPNFFSIKSKHNLNQLTVKY